MEWPKEREKVSGCRKNFRSGGDFRLKQKRNIGKPLLSLFLAMLLVLQTVIYSTAAYAESVPTDSGMEAVIESDSPSADEPLSVPEAVNDEPLSEPEAVQEEPLSVPEAVNDKPNNFVAMAAVPTDKTAVFMESNSTFPLEVTQGNAVINPNGIIQGRQPFTLKSEGLKVPVNGDDPNPTNADPEKYIQKGDWIELKREDYFKEVVLANSY